MTFKEYLLNEIETREECKNCPLHGKPIVLYDKCYQGNEKRCDVLFIGLNPGRIEGKEEIPFIGPPGQLLREKLEELGFFQDFNVAFTNAFLCATNSDREIPDLEECVVNCKSLLKDTVKFLRPRIFVPVGRNCADLVFGIRGPIAKISGKKHGTNNNIIPLMHPSTILYDRGTGDDAAVFDESLKELKKFIKCAPKDLHKRQKKRSIYEMDNDEDDDYDAE